MKAKKYSIKIEIEGLSKDITRHMAEKAVEQIMNKECPSGNLFMDDGDSVKWETNFYPVEF